MEKDMFHHRPDSNLADLLVTLSLVEVQVTRVAGIDYQALGGFILGTPFVDGLEQLLAVMLPLELRMYTQQR